MEFWYGVACTLLAESVGLILASEWIHQKIRQEQEKIWEKE